MPAVVGSDRDDAVSELEDRGFAVTVTTVTVTSSDQVDTVLAQNPAGGQAAEGSTVTITVGVKASRARAESSAIYLAPLISRAKLRGMTPAPARPPTPSRPQTPRSPSWPRTSAWPSPASHRRIRQQAASHRRGAHRVDPGRAGHDRAARPDHPRRAGGGRAGAAAEHDAHRRPARGVGLRHAGGRRRRPAGRACRHHRRRPRAARRAAARARTPSSHSASPSLTAPERALLARALPLLERLQDDTA